jgi:hypothetical protein
VKDKVEGEATVIVEVVPVTASEFNLMAGVMAAVVF